jgi:glucose-1-phosphate cytidylyltransferase
MKSVILCGGQGTRIRDVADDLPKPMIRIGERPIVWHIMQTYAAAGIADFVLCLGYKGWALKEYFLNLRAQVSDLTIGPQGVSYGPAEFPEAEWTIHLAETGLAAQTGARLWRVRDRLAQDVQFCLTYGDGVADIDVAEVVAFHRRHGKIATVTGVRPPGRFGVMTRNGDQVTSFSEKPQVGEGLINGGYFVFSRRVFDYLSDDPGLVLEHEPLQALAAAGELMLFEHTGFWQPMDTFREWKLLGELWDSGAAPWAR